MTRARRVYVWVCAAIALGSGWALAAATLQSPLRPQPGRPPPPGELPAPSKSAVDEALHAADGYISSLYRRLPGGRAVMSEYYDVPIRIRLERAHRWVLVGESDETRLGPPVIRAGAERGLLTLHPHGAGSSSVTLHITSRWDLPGSRYGVDVAVTRVPPVIGPFTVYVGDRRVGRFTPGRVPFVARLSRPDADRTTLRSLRWTIRHASAMGLNYFRYEGDSARAGALERTIRGLGYGVDYDLTAPIWGRGGQYGVNMPYDVRPQGFDAYHDCDVRPRATNEAYPYDSKVCRLSRRAYVYSSRGDALLPTVQAIHVLNKYGDPDHPYAGAPIGIADPTELHPFLSPGVDRTPRAVAAEVERVYRRLGFGVPRCTPLSCDPWGSGVRTFEFGALEAILGYRYGDTVSRAYADAAAAIALRVQIDGKGGVVTPRVTYHRPAARGGFYLAWDRSLRQTATANVLSGVLDAVGMRPEYRGLIPSNAETTLTAYAFLKQYRCVRFRVACARAPTAALKR